jgi:hypothetical protein
MLQRLSEEIAECYRRAGEAQRRAEQQRDPTLKRDFLEIERHWISLARSYEFTERVSSFTADVRRWIRKE